MRFILPQFIEYEAKIIGFLTFNQFLYMAMAGGVCFLLYFILPFSFFIIVAIVILIGTASLAFLKIDGRPVPMVLGNMLKFSLFPKIYIWKKKEISTVATTIKMVKSQSIKDKDEELPLKIAENSRLKKIKTNIESNTK